MNQPKTTHDQSTHTGKVDCSTSMIQYLLDSRALRSAVAAAAASWSVPSVPSSAAAAAACPAASCRAAAGDYVSYSK